MSSGTDRKTHPWKKNEVRDNIIQYYFDNVEGKVPNSIFVCIDDQRKKALILDTAYPEYSQTVRTDLESNGIQPEVVVLSHYHPDHSSGCVVFKDCEIYASHLYEDNLFNAQRWEPELTFLQPTKTVKDGDSLRFGNFHLKFTFTPGHCNCLMATLINDDVMHIGDLLMFNSDDLPTLPYVALGGGFKKFIASLEWLKRAKYNALLIPHGAVQDDRERINRIADGWIYYLRRMLETNGEKPVAECLDSDASNYANHEYHNINVMGLMMEM